MNQYLKYGALISPLGNSPDEHFKAILNHQSGITKCVGSGFNQEDLHLSKIHAVKGNRFQSLLIQACEQLLKNTDSALLKSDRTGIIISSTKGDLDALPNDTFESSGKILKQNLQLAHKPIIISNACISGVVAIITASDYLSAGQFDDVIIIGIDSLSDFVTYGFQSLFAISDQACKPFDRSRKGISLGEACGVLILSNHQDENQFAVEYMGGSSSNDANHISGPSRTGEGLYRSVKKTFDRTGLASNQIDFISAHGTGTVYNDDMESIAFNRLDMQECPVNSLKGYFGHTLGAAGVIETIISMLSIEHQQLFKSAGFQQAGTAEKINVLTEHKAQPVEYVLKTASGFGGGNASIILKKINAA